MKKTMLATTVAALLVVLAAGVAWAATVECDPGEPCEGTNQPDKLVGTDKPDLMNAKQDDDRLLGFRGGDLMFGDNPESSLANTVTDGDDELFANDGEDFLIGFGGDDLLRGGGRADGIIADDSEGTTRNPGEDTVIADGGRDFIFAQDGFRDTIDCGDNEDTVFFDRNRRLDILENCEILNPPIAAARTKAQELASLSRR